MRSADYQRGYDAGYRQALLDAVRGPRFDPHKKIGGPDAPYRKMRSFLDA